MNKKNNNAVKLCGLAVASVLAQGVVADVETVFENGMFRPEISLVADASRPLALANQIDVDVIDSANIADYGPGEYTIENRSVTLNHPLAHGYTINIGNGGVLTYNGNDRYKVVYGAAHLNISEGGKVQYYENNSGANWREFDGLLTMTGGEFKAGIGARGNSGYSGVIFMYRDNSLGAGQIRPVTHSISNNSLLTIESTLGLEFCTLKVSDNAVVKTKGFHDLGNKGHVIIEDASTVELGEIGWASTVDLNIKGGTVKGVADTVIAAPITVHTATGTTTPSIVANNGKTVTITGPIKGDAPINIGKDGSTGTVTVESGKLAEYTGKITVEAGTFDYTVTSETEKFTIEKKDGATVNVSVSRELHDQGFSLIEGEGNVLKIEKVEPTYTATVDSTGKVTWDPEAPKPSEGHSGEIIKIEGPTDETITLNPETVANLSSFGTIRVGGNITINDPSQFAGKTLDLDTDANVTIKGTTPFEGKVTGYGTIVADPGEEVDTVVIPKAALDTFGGTLELKSGRHQYTTAINQDVTIRVDDGAQIWVQGTAEWKNTFEIAGQGWNGDGSDVMNQGALRVSSRIGSQAVVKVLKTDDDKPTAICVNNYSHIYAQFAGEGDLQLLSNKPRTLTFANPSNPEFTGKVTVSDQFNIVIGEQPYPANGSVVQFGSSINVPDGKSLTINATAAASRTFDESGKAKVNTEITLGNNTTFTTTDGAYDFKKVTVEENATVSANLKWKKGFLFEDLVVPETSTVNVRFEGDDDADIYVGVNGGNVDGTINLANATARNNVLISGKADVLDGATINMNGNTDSFLVLRDDAAVKNIGGSRNTGVYGDGAGARELTIESGTLTTVADVKNAKNESNPLSLTINGNVTINDDLSKISGVVALGDKGATLTAPQVVEKDKIVSSVPDYHVVEKDGVFTLEEGAAEKDLRVTANDALNTIGQKLQDLLAGSETTVTVDAPFGGWYAVAAADTLEGLKSDPELKWVHPDTDGKLTLTIEKGEGSSRFYQVKASATDPNGEKVKISLR